MGPRPLEDQKTPALAAAACCLSCLEYCVVAGALAETTGWQWLAWQLETELYIPGYRWQGYGYG